MAHLDRIAAGSVIIAINSNPKEMACCVAWQPGAAGAGKKEQITLHFTFILILLLIFSRKAAYCEGSCPFSGWLSLFRNLLTSFSELL